MSDTTTPETIETVTPADLPVPAQQDPQDDGERQETFSAEYVRKLRAEAAEARVKAKIADVANEHLLAAFAQTDGRLRDVEALPFTEDLLGDDGLVSRDKVAEAIGDLVQRKPYLARPKPAPLPMGVQADVPADPSWLAALRGEIR